MKKSSAPVLLGGNSGNEENREVSFTRGEFDVEEPES